MKKTYFHTFCPHVRKLKEAIHYLMDVKHKFPNIEAAFINHEVLNQDSRHLKLMLQISKCLSKEDFSFKWMLFEKGISTVSTIMKAAPTYKN